MTTTIVKDGVIPILRARTTRTIGGITMSKTTTMMIGPVLFIKKKISPRRPLRKKALWRSWLKKKRSTKEKEATTDGEAGGTEIEAEETAGIEEIGEEATEEEEEADSIRIKTTRCRVIRVRWVLLRGENTERSGE
jgi:hypothetical protein